jgi:phosphoglycerate kinase
MEGFPVLEDLGDVSGKRVLLRADFNCPIAEGPDGKTVITDDYRIISTVPTIEWLLAHGAVVTVMSHFGRPKGKYDERYVLDPVEKRLAELVGPVTFLENVRFNPGEETNDDAFVQELIAGQDLYVNDAFAVSHRSHASVVGPPKYLPSAAGRQLEKEAQMMSKLLNEPERPFIAIVGGAKIADKLSLLKSLAQKVDAIVVGGGMSYTFQKALGHTTGDSIVDESKIEACSELLASGPRILLPIDLIALKPGGKLDFSNNLSDEEKGETEMIGVDVPDGFEAADIGPKTREYFSREIMSAATILWNGPMGAFEDERFAGGSIAIAQAVANSNAFSVVGGGDSVRALNETGLEGKVSHVSTGGGASLELIEKGDLPGLIALRNAPKAH